MLLQELLNSDVKYKIVRASSGSFKTRATIGKRDILFTASKNDHTDGLDSWSLEFEQISVDATGRKEFTFRKTNGGRPLEVFSMVKASIEEFLQRYHPEEIRFSAEKDDDGDDTRPQVYKRLLAKALPSFELVDEDDSHGEVFFVYRSKAIIPAK
jgi:hypothetical protein